MNVLFVSAEAYPFAKVGGLADVVGSLPGALREHDIDARIVMPGYGFINHARHGIDQLFSFEFTHREGTSTIQVFSTVRNGVPIYFIQGWPYFGNEDTTYTVWDWDSPRFIFFNQATLALMWELKQRLDWFPDLVHVHDWHTGLLPFLLDEQQYVPGWGRVPTMLTIHNLAYQGEYQGGWLFKAGISGRHHPDLVYQNLTDNLLAIAIAHSDIVTTVSPRYAVEIQYPYMGYGLDGMIRTRKDDLYGILNGLDTHVWDPATDPRITANYDADTFRERRIHNKRALQNQLGLDVRDDVPLVGFVSRLVWQKGPDLAIPALRQIASDTDMQFVALGTGDPYYEEPMRDLERDFPHKIRSIIDFNGTLAQLIYAGSDIFLMPSHFEPCGMGQMVAMRYGSLPLVRETGGLADTVDNYDNGPADYGTGFVFHWEQSDAVLGTLRWAIDTYYNRPDAWQRMQRRAMRRDFSWYTSARQYIDLYRKAIERTS